MSVTFGRRHSWYQFFSISLYILGQEYTSLFLLTKCNILFLFLLDLLRVSLAMHVHENRIMPDFKVVTGVRAEVIAPFPNQQMQIWWVLYSLYIYRGFHEQASANPSPCPARTVGGFLPLDQNLQFILSLHCG